MNSFITFACLLAVAGVSHGYGYGAPLITGPIYAPAAVSTANQIRGAPIPIIRTVSAPIIAPVIRTVPIAPVVRTVVAPVPVAPIALNGYGYGLNRYGAGYGLNGYGYGLNRYGAGYGLSGYGLNGYGLNRYGYGLNSLGLASH